MLWWILSTRQDSQMPINVQYLIKILVFLHELYKEGVRFNVYEFAAQKVLKYEKMQKEKAKKIE